jgi:hypothetical protein
MYSRDVYDNIVKFEEDNRQTGKTTALVRAVMADPRGVLVMCDDNMARAIGYLYPNLRITTLNKISELEKHENPYFDHTCLYELAAGYIQKVFENERLALELSRERRKDVEVQSIDEGENDFDQYCSCQCDEFNPFTHITVTYNSGEE